MTIHSQQLRIYPVIYQYGANQWYDKTNVRK